MTAMPGHLQWSALVGESLDVETPDGAIVPIVLDRCTLTDAATSSFTLHFRAGHDLPGQGTYLFRAPALPEAAVFMVPVGRDGDGIDYEAVFNLWTPPAPTQPRTRTADDE